MPSPSMVLTMASRSTTESRNSTPYKALLFKAGRRARGTAFADPQGVENTNAQRQKYLSSIHGRVLSTSTSLPICSSW